MAIQEKHSTWHNEANVLKLIAAVIFCAAMIFGNDTIRVLSVPLCIYLAYLASQWDQKGDKEEKEYQDNKLYDDGDENKVPYDKAIEIAQKKDKELPEKAEDDDSALYGESKEMKDDDHPAWFKKTPQENKYETKKKK